MDNIRALIVDDSAVMRKIVERSLRQAGLRIAEVVEASNGAEALAAVRQHPVDLIPCDINMPVMDGLEFVKQFSQMESAKRVPVVMITTEGGEGHVVQALAAGARGYVPKQLSSTSLDILHIQPDLTAKIRAAAQSRTSHSGGNGRRKPPCSASLEYANANSTSPTIVALGTSTGGPKALQEILPLLPHELAVPVLIVQHMPLGFTAPFAQRLNALCSVTVREAAHQELLQPGVVYIAPAGRHMTVERVAGTSTAIRLDTQPEHCLHMPSVDIMMKSVAKSFGSSAMGVIMTGMGSDGAEGMKAIHREGGLTVGQDEASCVVYGMPRACAEVGVLSRVVPLSEIPAQIVQATRCRRQA
jgi:two-component system, chemotaxis family, protein-glutamate methylesterase/glutaminase